MIRNRTKILLFLLAFLALNSCSTTKKVPDGEYLLLGNEFEFEGKEKPFKASLADYVKQKPNNKMLGVLPIRLYIFNWSPKELDETFEEYFSLTKKKRNQKALDSILIKNELDKYVGKSLWLKRFLYNTGTPPVILEPAQSSFSEENLENFYHDRGYFDAEVTAENIYKDNKKGKVKYHIIPGEESIITSFDYKIDDPDLETLYHEIAKDISINVGERFDMKNFENEKSRITYHFKDNGYYDFNRNEDELYFEADTIPTDKELDVTMFIGKDESDSLKSKFRKYKINEVNIYPDSKKSDRQILEGNYKDTIYEGYKLRYQNHAMKYRPKYFTDVMLMEPGSFYRISEDTQTKRNLFRRENVTVGSFDIIPVKEEDSLRSEYSLLNVDVFLQPKKRYDLNFFLEGYYSDYVNLGISPGMTLLMRNLFGGGENWETTFKGTLADVSKDFSRKSGFLSAQEINLQTRLRFPYMVFPFHSDKLFPKHFYKQSDIRLGMSTQRNIGLGRTTYSTGLDYVVSARKNHQHQLSILNTEFVNNSEKNRYYSVYTGDGRIFKDFADEHYANHNPQAVQDYYNETISADELTNIIAKDNEFISGLEGSALNDYVAFENMLFRKASITQDVLISSLIYQYTFDQNSDSNIKNPWFVRGRVEFAGNILGFMDDVFSFKKIETEGGKQSGSVLDVPYSQFLKVDLDVRKYWNFSSKSSIAARFFVGLTEPYGNLKIVPFVRSYSAGGSNDIRAWEAGKLGPSDVPRYNAGNSVLAIENMKLLLSAEYRFNMAGRLNGALFLDAGNIWGTDRDYKPSLFKIDEFYKQLGIGGGFGIRLDLTYVLARLDFAYKIHDPSYKEGDRWRFDNINILKPRIAFGINYPF